MTTTAIHRKGFSLLCVWMLSSLLASTTHAATYQKSYTISGRASVRVLAANGAVRVTTSDAETVEFIVDYDRGTVPSDLPVESRRNGNAVELRAFTRPHSWWWNWSFFEDAHLSIEVRMPKNADLQIDTSNGAVTLGPISGTVQVHTSNGPISAHSLEGRCVLVTSNGWVEANGRFQSLDIWTSNASVVARAQPGSRMATGWSVRTSNGGINLSIPPDLNANLTAGTTNGGILLQLPVALQGEQHGSHLHGTLGGGGPEIFVSTSNAGVRLDRS